MIKRSDIHTFEDESFLKRTARLSAVAFVAGLGAGAAVVFALIGSGAVSLDPEIAALFTAENAGAVFQNYVAWFAMAAIATAASLIVHELVHGVYFKLFAPRGARVTFGANWKRGMLYACADGIVYTRCQYLVIALAPTFAVTALLVLAGVAFGRPVVGVFAAVLHLTGCAGDWAYAEEIHRDPAIAFCMDTDWGVCFYAEGESDGEMSRLGTGAFWDIRRSRRMSQNAPVPNRDTPGTSPTGPSAEGDAE
ncbi:DUF3267 domain-containing protein [Enorma sp.]|uniref:DUF3267 domain-containing protein n=1 Tax=Enorma sp. TaxID=1920692 RepID=UPI0025C1BB24|nr:DUF3267 domain-containing protein [Enorma sp.]